MLDRRVEVFGSIASEEEERLLIDANIWITDQGLPEGQFCKKRFPLGLIELHARFGDRIRFVLVNVREAHPGKSTPQPKTIDEKMKHAEQMRDFHRFKFDVAVDDIDGSFHRAMSPKVNSAYGNRVNPIAIHDYLAQGYPTTPDTCWQDIQLMEPGTWLEVGHQGMRKGRYWQWLPRQNPSLNIEDATQNMKETLVDSLRSHLSSDVPIGAFLSGGLDSSVIVALLSKGINPGIQTFNMGFSDQACDESGYARRVAEHCSTEHREIRMETGAANPALFQRILEQYDEPFGDSSCIPTFLICGEIRKHVKVVLSGC